MPDFERCCASPACKCIASVCQPTSWAPITLSALDESQCKGVCWQAAAGSSPGGLLQQFAMQVQHHAARHTHLGERLSALQRKKADQVYIQSCIERWTPPVLPRDTSDALGPSQQFAAPRRKVTGALDRRSHMFLGYKSSRPSPIKHTSTCTAAACLPSSQTTVQLHTMKGSLALVALLLVAVCATAQAHYVNSRWVCGHCMQLLNAVSARFHSCHPQMPGQASYFSSCQHRLHPASSPHQYICTISPQGPGWKQW